jgi:AcrR family transcriptional regulator
MLYYGAAMPRPRVYDPNHVLDAVESLAVASGPGAVTIRAISAVTGVSNGAVYHTFGSRSGLMGRAWLRAGRRFLTVQTSLVDQAMSAPSPRASVEAVVAAADAPVVFAEQYPDSSRLLLTVHREELLNSAFPTKSPRS